MRLPRWTVFPALAVLALGMSGVVRLRGKDPLAGAAALEAAASAHAREPHARLVVLGIDGLDPEIVAEACRLWPERTVNFRELIDANGLHSLGTSTPPQSPVAWSSFITGLDPGGHGVFDFIHRDPMTRAVATSTTREDEPGVLARLASHAPLPFDLALPAVGETVSNRSGEAFWTVLARYGVPADVWRMPANFPVEASEGWSFSGMMTPALDSAYGECTLYTTDPARKTALGHSKVELVSERAGRIDTRLMGPPNTFQEGQPHQPAPLVILIDRQAGAAVLDVGGQSLVLRPGQWSGFVRIEFSLLPAGIADLSGIARFYLRSLSPEFELYASPVNIDPLDPVVPVALPEEASAEVAEAIGLYYTQGMAEDVNALKAGILGDEEFMQQVDLVHRESRRMLEHALERYQRRAQGGLLFFYFSTVDLTSHMMWRHTDPAHPAHDAAFAARSSEAWSERKGSTWRETVLDLVLQMDPVIGLVRKRLGRETPLVVMSDHGFAPYTRRFNLNTWLLENGYLVLREGQQRELPAGHPEHRPVLVGTEAVDWSRTRAYGIGFQGLYLNLQGRERDDPSTDSDESGIVPPGEPAQALALEIKAKLEALVDPATGRRPVLRADLAAQVYTGARAGEAPDIVVGYDSGYGNSDQATVGRITADVLEDNRSGSFNGNHLMAPDVVPGILLSNRPVRPGAHRLEDLTVEVLRRFGLPPLDGMKGHAVLD